MSKIFINLPNELPVPNAGNLVNEATHYLDLYMDLSRTSVGQVTYVSTSSGKTYSTSSYAFDTDVYNKGTTGMMNLLYKYVLKNYIVEAESLNGILDGSTMVGNSERLSGQYLQSMPGGKGVPYLNTDYGTIEIGQYIDFHAEEGQDYDTRLTSDNGELTLDGKFYADNMKSTYVQSTQPTSARNGDIWVW